MNCFSGVRHDLGPILRNAHVWGCPVHVLDPKIQDGKKLPRWQPKSRRGQFLGFSKSHASTIALIRNCRTGSVTPQFHVVFDEWFQTLPSVIDPQQVTIPNAWHNLIQFSRFKFFDEDGDPRNLPPDLADEWTR